MVTEINQWVSVTTSLPNKHGHYLVTCDLNMYRGGNLEVSDNRSVRSIQVAYFCAGAFNMPEVIAWAELPSIYTGKTEAMKRDQLTLKLHELNGHHVNILLTDGRVEYGLLNFSDDIITLINFSNKIKIDMSHIKKIMRAVI